METLSPLNIQKVCRVCLLECDPMFSIYSEIYEDHDDFGKGNFPCIFEILGCISSMKVQIADGLPTLICTKCIDLAHVSFKFQKQCNNSQIILESYLNRSQQLQQQHNLDIPPILLDDKSDFDEDLINLEHINASDLVVNHPDEIDTTKLLLNDDGIFELPSDSLLEYPLPNHNPTSTNCNESIEPNSKSKAKSKPKLIIRNPEADQEKSHACKLCDKSYKYKNSLRLHMRNHTEQSPFECKTCGKQFKQYDTFVYHERKHKHDGGHKCDICGKKYKQQGTLTAHYRIHSGEKPFSCKVCGRTFRQAPDLGYHMRVHTKEKPYECTICGKTMSMNSHLVQHMRTHTGERPFKCTQCDKSFPSSSQLKRHTNIHTGLKPYTCPICDKAFSRINALKEHTKTHTKTNNKKTYKCPICSKVYVQNDDLRSHMITHSSELTATHIDEYLINGMD